MWEPGSFNYLDQDKTGKGLEDVASFPALQKSDCVIC